MDPSFPTLLRQIRVTHSDVELPATDLEFYKHAPLDNPSTDIRLVTILPGKFSDPISVEIRHTSLPHYHEPPTNRTTLSQLRKTLPGGWQAFETPEGRFVFCNRDSRWHRSSWIHPKFECNSLVPRLEATECPDTSVPYYEALSYCWGSKQNAEIVFVESCEEKTTGGGIVIQTHENLANALRHLRYEKLPRVMWIDAICINQEDEIERGQQVQRMADIYRQASRVIVWLGPEGGNSDLAISVLSYLSQQVEISKDGFLVPSPTATEPDWYDYETELPYNYKTWEAIANLARRDWFQRLWIVQEIQLANLRATMVCGDSSILWCHFRRCVIALIRRRGLDISQHNALIKLQTLCIGSANLSISGVIEEHYSRICADPRDKIYGILGILPKEFRSKVVPRYTLSTPQVYQDVLLAHIDYTDRLEFLRFCRLHPNQTTADSPSWVFNSSDILLRFPISQFASGYSRAAARHIAPNILEVLGVRAATITNLSEPTPDTYKGCVSAIPDWEPPNLRDGKYITGGTLLDAFAITVCGFVIRDRAPEVIVPPLSSWRELNWSAALLSCLGNPGGDMNPSFGAKVLAALRRRRFLSTAEGYIGLAPSETRTGKGDTIYSKRTITLILPSAAGDILVVILGCASPIVLRPGPEGTYTVIGESFVYGLNDANAILGPLPDGWTVQAFTDASGFTYDHRFVHKARGIISDDDPRLELLTGWERVRRDRTNRDPELFQCYRNKLNGEEMNSDPRLCPEALKRSGKNLDLFRLV